MICRKFHFVFVFLISLFILSWFYKNGSLTGKRYTYKIDYLSGYSDIRNPAFIKYLAREWIYFPSGGKLNLQKPVRKDFSQHGQALFVDKLLGMQRNGTFIECGAFDGEDLSNTLYLERERGWRGLLIEPNQHEYAKLKRKNRNVFSVNACISPVNSSTKIQFATKLGTNYLAGIIDHLSDRARKGVKETSALQCLPLISILDAINFTHINYFSLDVEGAELQILKTIPLHEVKVDVFTIEYLIQGDRKGTAKKLVDLTHFFHNLGLYRKPHVLRPLDVVFVRKEVMSQKKFDAHFVH